VKVIIIAFFALIALGKFGITIAPFIAGLSVVGFGTSFALQGPLSNYAAGVSLIFTKPFKVGDIIEVTGVMGEVQDMTLARTELKTVDGTKIVIPNKQIIGEIIHNYSELKKVDITVGVSYDSDMDKAIKVVKEVINGDKRVSREPESKIGISEFADSSINIYARIWCKQAEYWDVMFDINKGINDAFNKNNITIPFPQRDIHVYSQKPKGEKERSKTWAEYSE
jgi:small conductance mechanosensitive channel